MEAADHDLLVRIDERTLAMHSSIGEIAKTYVTRKEFLPVKSIVYGAVGIILIAVFSALVYTVVSK